ncbi:unnamed protein product [Dibothriocephalus latus]|uniref:Uncharacterized protein n=1 Tax=Dibothriocephalus latus TaxID=60516 RepID=A0A3P7M2T2_DIBLA|nr:unnamed protein product [Dibothriocephalus latus]
MNAAEKTEDHVEPILPKTAAEAAHSSILEESSADAQAVDKDREVPEQQAMAQHAAEETLTKKSINDLPTVICNALTDVQASMKALSDRLQQITASGTPVANHDVQQIKAVFNFFLATACVRTLYADNLSSLVTSTLSDGLKKLLDLRVYYDLMKIQHEHEWKEGGHSDVDALFTDLYLVPTEASRALADSKAFLDSNRVLQEGQGIPLSRIAESGEDHDEAAVPKPVAEVTQSATSDDLSADAQVADKSKTVSAGQTTPTLSTAQGLADEGGGVSTKDHVVSPLSKPVTEVTHSALVEQSSADAQATDKELVHSICEDRQQLSDLANKLKDAISAVNSPGYVDPMVTEIMNTATETEETLRRFDQLSQKVNP